LLALNEALDKFAVEHKPKAELVKLRYFAGLKIPEAADILGVSEPNATGLLPVPGCRRKSTRNGNNPIKL